MRRLALLPLLTAVVLASGCTGSSDATPTPTPDIDGVQVVTGLKHDHLKAGQPVPTYAQSPPVGGPHSPAWLRCQVYDVPVPLINVVHSMEHGGMWIAYRPDLPAADVEALTQKVILNKEFVLVSPLEGLTAPVVVSTWGLQLTATGADDPRIDAFIREYAGGEQGGEKGVGCASTGVTLEQAQQLEQKRLAG